VWSPFDAEPVPVAETHATVTNGPSLMILAILYCFHCFRASRSTRTNMDVVSRRFLCLLLVTIMATLA
jgi:hypothetical protein